VSDALHSFTLADSVREQARTLPGEPALVEGERRTGFAAVDAESSRWAAWLAARGVRAGGRLAWLGPSDRRLLLAMFGAAKLGAATVPLNWRCTVEELAFTIDHSEPALLLGAGDEVERARGAAGEGIQVLDAAEAEIEVEATDPGDPHGDRDDEAAVLGIYTAAFSGRPRLALLSHRAIVTQSLVLGAYRVVDPEDEVYLASGPMFHVGVLLKLFATFIFGGSNVLAPSLDAGELCRLIEANRVTAAFLFTPTIDQIVEANVERRWDLSSLRDVPGRPSEPHLEAWREMTSWQPPRGAGVVGYGQTETYAMVTLESRGPATEARFGRPTPVAAIRILDPEGAERPVGEAGEIAVRGPQVMLGYADGGSGGWHRTGDLGVRLADGGVEFLGPIQEIVKTGMENVYPAEVEAVLRRHAAVAEVCVIGVESARWGEAVRAVVELEPGADCDEEELVDLVRSHIASYKKPRSIFFVEVLPRAGGGVDRAEVKREWGGSKTDE
jgi:acyl-CoA synthetase (AMP-forming)/AMP-acid ligase II